MSASDPSLVELDGSLSGIVAEMLAGGDFKGAKVRLPRCRALGGVLLAWQAFVFRHKWLCCHGSLVAVALPLQARLQLDPPLTFVTQCLAAGPLMSLHVFAR